MTNRLGLDVSRYVGIPLDALGLGARAYNALRRGGVDTLADLLKLSEEELLHIRNFGPTSVGEIKKRLAEFDDGQKYNPRIANYKPRKTLPSPAGKIKLVDTDLSARIRHALERADILTVGDLLQWRQVDQVAGVRNLGGIALREIDEFIGRVESMPQGGVVGGTGNHETLFYDLANGQLAQNRPIDECGFSRSTAMALSRAEIPELDALLQLDDQDLYRLRKSGKFSAEALVETRDFLERFKPLEDWSWSGLLRLGLKWDGIEALVVEMSNRKYPNLVPLPEHTVFGHEVLEYLVRVGCPLHSIEARRVLVTETSRPQHVAASAQSLLDMCLMSEAELRGWLGDDAEEYLENLDWYLQHLPSFDWEAEIVGMLPNPVVVWRLQHKALNQLLIQILADRKVDLRGIEILLARVPLRDLEMPTLEDLGQRYGVTRERIRQIEHIGKKRAAEALRTNEFIRTIEFLATSVVYQQGVISRKDLEETMGELYGFQNQGLEQGLSMILNISNTVEYEKRLDAFVSPQIPQGLLWKLHSHFLEVLRSARAPVHQGDLSKSLNSILTEEELSVNYLFELWQRVLEYSRDFEVVEEQYWGLTSWESRVVDEIVMALREAGKPTHFSVVTQLTTTRLGMERSVSEHSVHATLARYPDIFVRTGPGTFALREWKPDSPAQPTRYRSLIARILEESGKPLKMNEIHEKVNALRAVKLSTVTMYLTMHDDFEVHGDGTYGLTAWNRRNVETASESLPDEFQQLLRERAMRAFEERQSGAL